MFKLPHYLAWLIYSDGCGNSFLVAGAIMTIAFHFGSDEQGYSGVYLLIGMIVMSQWW